MLAFAEIEREEMERIRNPGGPEGIQETRTANAIYRSAEGAGAYDLLASMVAPEPDPQPPA